MIPILFETTETTFTSNGIGRLTEAISCEVEEERNGVYELTLEYPMTGRLYGEISEGRFIYSRHSDALDAQPFRIYKITKPMDGIVTVHAHHRSYDLNHVIVQPFTAGSAAETMQRISLNTLNACPFTFWTDKSVTADFNLKVPASIRGILGGAEGSILDVYGKGEYEWDNATVKLHLNRGTDTGVTIMYGKNLTDINEESTAENLVSAVAPFWKDAEGENVVVLPEGILTLAGASSENALPLDLSDKFDEAPTVEDLRSKANTWLANNGKLEPESNIRLSFAQLWQTEEYKSYALLQRVNLCDTVTVIYPALGVKAKTKVIRVVYDALLERYTKMELGEPKSTLSGTLARQEETVRQIVRSFQYPTISQVNAAVNTATKLITGGMGGHVVIGTNANGQPNEILIMDTDDIDTAVNVIRMNANGIGFSTTGYNGPFNTAWTIDGAFVADFITSGTLDANLIRAGIIMDKAGKNYWNLETGEISIDASAIGEDYVTSSQLEVTKNGIMTSVSQTYVTKGNAVSSVATQYYSSTSPDSQQGGSWQDTVPDWQDGRYIFEKTTTTTADGQSEEKIVCISGATGATGERGPGIYKVTTEPSSFETETGGFTPTYRIALATVKIQSGVSDVFVGDVIEYDVYHYPVGYVDASYVYLGARTSIKGADGLPATAYTLIVSHAAIVKSASGTFSPTSITLTAKSQTGTNAYANYSGRFKIEVYNGSSWSTKYTSSSNENTKSYTIPSGTTQVRCSLYLADGTTTLLDQQTVPVVSDGAAGGDAYTIILDNESHTFAGGASAAIAGTATVNVYAYKGATAIAPTVTKANISGLPTGMSVQSVTNDSTNKKSTIVFAVTTSMVTRSGMVTIPVVADGKTFNKEFSYSLALQGTKGDTGDKGDKGDKGDTGDKGDKGVGVTSITKTGTSGTVDTYTITYTDGTTSTFSVTNGTNGTSAEWFYGTALTHTSGTATATISGAKVGDMYLNTATSNVYKCTAKNVWTYAGNIADGVIDNISIGGRNLLKGTGNYSEWNAPPSSESRLIRTTEYIRFNPYEERAWWWIEPHDAYIPIDEWDTTAKYTASIDIKFEGLKTPPSYPSVDIMTAQNNTTQGYSCRVYEKSFECIPSTQGDWVHYTYTFDGDYTKWSHPGSGESLYVKGLIWLYINSSEVDAVYIRNFKLEKGNRATDWTPAPEDVDASIAAAQATADRKKQTFISTPTTPYYVGDIYFVNGKLLVCHTERLTGSYTADDWSEDLGYASSDTVATLEASTKTELDTIRSEASANYTSLSDSLDKIQASFNTQVEQTSEDFSIRINGLLESLTSLANDTSTKFAEYSKYFRFTADGLEIGEESNALTLVLDNDKISFRRNGVEFSYWDGSDNSFHVGDIIVDVNQVARFGSFGLVPLEGGDLAWKWLGGST